MNSMVLVQFLISRSINSGAIFFVFLFLFFSSGIVLANGNSRSNESEKAFEAAELILKLCGAQRESLTIEGGGRGDIRLRRLLGSGAEGEISLSKKEAIGVVDILNDLSAQQATEMRECARPFIGQILILMGLSAENLAGPSEKNQGNIGISVNDGIFREEEYSIIACFVALNYGHKAYDGNFSVNHVVSGLKDRGFFPPSLVLYYLNVMLDAKILEQKSSSDQYFEFGPSLRAYVLRYRIGFNSDGC